MKTNTISRLFCSILVFFFLFSCAQESTRKDIQDKLQGTWTGVIKDVDLNVTNEVTIVFDEDNYLQRKNVFIDSLGNKKLLNPSSNKYRVFIYTNKNIEVKGDTVIEGKPNIIESIHREPFYLKVHFFNKNEIWLFPLFKYNERQLLGGNGKLKLGFYLKRDKVLRKEEE
jgi:hypothetical protein